VTHDTRSVLAESFRLVRSNLQNAAFNAQHRSILVTSAVSGDGKSFTAINLALTLAGTGKKTILVGLDLRKPKMESYLSGEISEKGITNYLRGEVSLANIIKIHEQSHNLHYVDCGQIPHNPTELLMSERMKNMFDYLNKGYDFIVVDGAPIGVVADSFELKPYVQQTLIVLRYGSTTTSHLKFLSEAEQDDKLPNINVVLNDVRREFGNSYNYGYYSTYYYQEKKGLMDKIKTLFKGKKPKKRVKTSSTPSENKVSV
jgi:tyrosine-protein kinase Etk/Wzc